MHLDQQNLTYPYKALFHLPSNTRPHILALFPIHSSILFLFLKFKIFEFEKMWNEGKLPLGDAPRGTSLSARRFFKQTTPIRPRGDDEKKWISFF